MPPAEIHINDKVILGGADLVLIAGPCVIESEQHALGIARAVAAIAARVVKGALCMMFLRRASKPLSRK